MTNSKQRAQIFLEKNCNITNDAGIIVDGLSEQRDKQSWLFEFELLAEKAAQMLIPTKNSYNLPNV